jgi:hypothetical protein
MTKKDTKKTPSGDTSQEDLKDIENSLERVSKFLDKDSGKPSEEWLRLNDMLFSAIDFTDSRYGLFPAHILKQIQRFRAAHISGHDFDPTSIFEHLIKMDQDETYTSFRQKMGEKMDQFLLDLAKKTRRR